jgi:hypothetical protein
LLAGVHTRRADGRGDAGAREVAEPELRQARVEALGAAAADEMDVAVDEAGHDAMRSHVDDRRRGGQRGDVDGRRHRHDRLVTEQDVEPASGLGIEHVAAAQQGEHEYRLVGNRRMLHRRVPRNLAADGAHKRSIALT